MLSDYTMEQLEERIGYKFGNQMLLKQAVTHSSFANEQRINRGENYERLEFLGDAVLELVSSDFLFREHAAMPEGRLTQLRASLVCEPALAFCARDLDLEKFILLGRGEEVTGGRARDSIVSDVMEAGIGAVYLAHWSRRKPLSTVLSCPIWRTGSCFMTAKASSRRRFRAD